MLLIIPIPPMALWGSTGSMIDTEAFFGWALGHEDMVDDEKDEGRIEASGLLLLHSLY